MFDLDLYVTRDRPGAINLLRAERPDRLGVHVAGRRLPGGALLGANQDIADGTKAARIFYTLDPDAPYGNFRISLDSAGTLFVSGDTGEAIPVDISGSYSFIVIREPAGLSLLGAAGSLLIRRRGAA